MRRLRYDWLGAALGLVLPAVATCIAAWNGELSLRAIVAAQRSNPLLWLMDTAPFVLAVAGWTVDRQQRVVAAQQLRIAKLESQRRASVERTAVELSGTALNLLRDVSAMAAASAQMTASVRGTIDTMRALSHGATAVALAAETVAGRSLDAASQPEPTVEALTATLRSSAGGAREIARIAQEQMDGIDRVLAAMNEIHFATETSAASTHEIAAEARALARRARDLRGAVAGGEGDPADSLTPANGTPLPARAADAAGDSTAAA